MATTSSTQMAATSSTPTYCSTPTLRFVKEGIKNPHKVMNKNGTLDMCKLYEEDISSWATTLLKKSLFRR